VKLKQVGILERAKAAIFQQRRIAQSRESLVPELDVGTVGSPFSVAANSRKSMRSQAEKIGLRERRIRLEPSGWVVLNLEASNSREWDRRVSGSFGQGPHFHSANQTETTRTTAHQPTAHRPFRSSSFLQRRLHLPSGRIIGNPQTSPSIN
jgi:hypothetical protein